MRNKEFIPYEQALALQQLGFNEECFGTWFELEGKYSVIIRNNLYGNDLQTPSPLYQQAFRWFREKYNLDGFMSIDVWNKKTTTYSITGGIEGVIEATSYGDLYDIDSKDYETYEEAELECLKKLIEIVKEKK